MNLPSCLQGTRLTKLERVEIVNIHDKWVTHFLTDKMLLGEEVTYGRRNDREHLKG